MALNSEGDLCGGVAKAVERDRRREPSEVFLMFGVVAVAVPFITAKSSTACLTVL